MPGIPELGTERLKLRPFEVADAPAVAELCGEWQVASTTASIPHPYDESMAEEWIGGHPAEYKSGEGLTFAITLADDGALVGAIGMRIDPSQHLGELGYWIGKPYWNRGYATEAVKAVMAYGFDELGLNRIQARFMTRNPASGRVMEKAGMSFEGVLRQSIYRWGEFEDAAMFSVLREEYRERGAED